MNKCKKCGYSFVADNDIVCCSLCEVNNNNISYEYKIVDEPICDNKYSENNDLIKEINDKFDLGACIECDNFIKYAVESGTVTTYCKMTESVMIPKGAYGTCPKFTRKDKE